MPLPPSDADVTSTGGLPPAVQPYVIPRLARQQARVLVLQIGMFLGIAIAVVMATHGAGPSLAGLGVVFVILLASFASQDLYLAAIGADGLLLCRRGGESFFVAHGDLEGCELQAEGGLVLVLRGGAEVPVLDDPARNRQGLVTVAVQKQRILAARARCVGVPVEPPLVHDLERGDHHLDAWVAALHGLARPDGGAYRSNTLSLSVLWQIAEDGRLGGVARVAAIVALSTTLDAKGRARLQRVWLASANPYVQEAVAAAQDNRAIALREVLDAVSRLDVRSPRIVTGVRVIDDEGQQPGSEAEVLGAGGTRTVDRSRV